MGALNVIRLTGSAERQQLFERVEVGCGERISGTQLCRREVVRLPTHVVADFGVEPFGICASHKFWHLAFDNLAQECPGSPCKNRELMTVLTTTMTTVGLPDTLNYATVDIALRLVTQSARGYGSDGWGSDPFGRAAYRAHKPPGIWKPTRPAGM